MYPLRLFGDPVLKQRARDVEDFDGDLVTLVHGMYDTMDLEEGVGLAAPQVGVRKRLFTFDLHEGEGPAVVINPEIVERDGEVLSEEGCLSVPGYRFEVVRAERVTMRGLDLDGVEPDVRREALRDMRTRELGATASIPRTGPDRGL